MARAGLLRRASRGAVPDHGGAGTGGAGLISGLWALFSGGGEASSATGARRYLPTLWDLLDWLEELDLADRPFTLDELRRRLAAAMGVEIRFVTAREIVYAQAHDPEMVYQVLKGLLMSEGGMNGGMVRDPATEVAWVLTPGDLRSEEAPKPPLHELMHVALGDPVRVEEGASFPESEAHKLFWDRDGHAYWRPDAAVFSAPRLLSNDACEQRAEVLAEYALLASLHGGEALRELDDHFWS